MRKSCRTDQQDAGMKRNAGGCDRAQIGIGFGITYGSLDTRICPKSQ